MPNTGDESGTPGPAEADPSEIASVHADEAARHLREGDREAALAACQDVLALSEVGVHSAARVSHILRALGQTGAADQVRDLLLERLDRETEQFPDNAQLLGEAGLVSAFLGRDDRGEILMREALRLDPGDPHFALSLTRIYLRRGETATALDIWGPTLEVADDPGVLLLVLARVFGQFGFLTEAEGILERAEPLCAEHRMKFEIAAAGLRGTMKDLDQHAVAVDVFDDFADSYDDVLRVLENNGPTMIERMIAEIGLAADASRRVLDAGCGTGLCALLLRPYAANLAGADISPKMLAKAGEKGVYDTLTRTDLSVRFTFPEGQFDLVVSSDVMVYFGDLAVVFSNIYDCLNPGGWFVFTVESVDDVDAPLGHRTDSSGRFAHSRAYLTKVLAECGFFPPSHIFSDTIRLEMGEPIAAYVIGAQKPALSMGHQPRQAPTR